MASAASSIFAITEILEQILVQVAVTTTIANSNSQATVKHLFALQRTNRAFLLTIVGSPELRRLMGLDQWLPSQMPRLPSGDRSHFAPYLEWPALVLNPFKLQLVMAHESATVDEQCRLNINLTISASDMTRVRRRLEDRTGMLGGRNAIVHNCSDSSWRMMWLSPYDWPTTVGVDIQGASRHASGFLGTICREVHRFGSGVTLGDFCELLDAMVSGKKGPGVRAIFGDTIMHLHDQSL